MIIQLQQIASALAALITIVNAQAAALPENMEVIAQKWLVQETLEAKVTAYSSSPEETDSTPDITANGERTAEGGIACPRKYPFGTLFYINELIYRCNDRMHIRFDDRFDLWMPNKKSAIKFGIQKQNVKVIIPLY